MFDCFYKKFQKSNGFLAISTVLTIFNDFLSIRGMQKTSVHFYDFGLRVPQKNWW